MLQSYTTKQKECFNCSSKDNLYFTSDYRRSRNAFCVNQSLKIACIEKDFEEFLEIVRNENEKELRRKLQSQTRELADDEMRIQALDRFIQILYENKVCSILTDE